MKINNMTKGLTLLFFTVSILDIIGVALNNSLLQTIFKPMIILSLVALYYFTVDKKNNWYLFALAFSLLGDILLMDKNNLFIYGIGAFLITQILYIIIIVRQMQKPSNFHKYLYAFLFVNYVVYLLTLLKPNLGDLFLPRIGLWNYNFGIWIGSNLKLCNQKNKIGSLFDVGSHAIHRFR